MKRVIALVILAIPVVAAVFGLVYANLTDFADAGLGLDGGVALCLFLGALAWAIETVMGE